jgi:hypothetical protein
MPADDDGLTTETGRGNINTNIYLYTVSVCICWSVLTVAMFYLPVKYLIIRFYKWVLHHLGKAAVKNGFLPLKITSSRNIKKCNRSI